MRQIKFRGKQIDNGEWVYGFYWFHKNHSEHLIRANLGKKDARRERTAIIDYDVDPATVGQFTGLHDKKRTDEYPEGQEIYEGDICRYQFKAEHYHPLTVNNKDFQFTVEHGDYQGGDGIIYSGFKIWDNTKVEILGDIHSNPELIENGTK